MTWETDKPIFGRLPQPYQDSEPAEWVTKPWDGLLVDSRETVRNFHRDYLDPDTAKESALDWLAQFAGYTGDYWDPRWNVAVKRTLIKNAYSLVWPMKGTAQLLQWIMTQFGLPVTITYTGAFIAGVSKAGDPIGSSNLEFRVSVSSPLEYLRSSEGWQLIGNLVELYKPVFVQHIQHYDHFYAGISAAGDPVLD